MDFKKHMIKISILFSIIYCLPCYGLGIYEKSRLLEKTILEAWPDVFDKKENILSIKFHDGTTKTLIDNREFDFQPKITNYVVAYWPQHKVVILNHTKKAGEVSALYLYSMETAKYFEQSKKYIGGLPILSPDDKMFAAFDKNNATENFNGVNIFQFEKTYIINLGSIRSELWGASHLEWIDNSHIKIVAQRNCTKPECTKERIITIESNGIQIQ
jgi:hypothetical protein